MLAKNKGFTAVAVATLALGIGANTAIFSLVNAVMLQSIPVRNPKELVVFRWSAHGRPKDIGSSSYGDCPGTDWGPKFSGGCSFSYPVFQEIRNQRGNFSGVATFAGPAQLDLSGNGTATIAHGELVSGDYFQTLGVPASAGRVLEPADEKPGAEAVTVLTYAYWQTAFGGASNAIGKNIKLNGVPFTIVGVTDPGFTRLTPGRTQDMWLPLSQAGALRLHWGRGPEKDRTWWLTIVGRLKPGVSREQAESAVSTLFHNEVIEKKLLTDEDKPQVALIPAQKGLSGVRGRLSEPLFILMAAVGIVLLISCANVAGLMLARAASRDKEMAVRLALGSGRGRLIRQLLTESVMLSLAGAGLGIILSIWGANALSAFVFSNRDSSSAINANPDLRVLVFTVAIAALTGILFGLAPAFRSARVNIAPALKANAGNFSGAGAGPGRKFGLGSGLVVAQVALSVIVMAGAGLIVRTLANLKNIDPGFNTQNVLQFGIDPTLTGVYKDDQVEPLYRELSRRLSALPGVTSVSYSSDTLLDGSLWTEDARIEGGADKSTVEVQMLAIGPDFFETMKIPLMAGRTLTTADAESKRTLAIVNREFVRRFVENGQALGLHFGGTDAKDPQYEIVGIVGDTKYAGLRDETAPTAYIPVN